ncbi:hypothetical protein E1B28_008831 [Marasmius oreades]|uniref:Uncharacterized protein n=1 Tax=Marasmius oreades TaxID=181124 RepID=A0A9P7UUP2_9AGAR|nr:uncharacterized protein E1B28_008831 [Marasmius oreades]KAG7092479.1 hypothetical protein E1B28_008831 [Marasmius oreades]
MDTHVFASLAQVRILLVPIGPISSTLFEKHASEIRSFDSIRLGDIPEANNDERARFTPKPLSMGHLHLSYPSHPPPAPHSPLSLIRPSHFPLAVIGIASCSQTVNISSVNSQFNSAVLTMFSGDVPYPLAKNCFVFEEGDGTSSISGNESIPGLVIFPSVMGNTKLYIGTLLADLCSNILGEFSVLLQRLENPLGNEYLNASSLPTLPPLSEMPLSLDMTSGRLPTLPSHNSHPEISRVTSLSAPQMKRNSSLGVPTAKKRISGIGAASSDGRLYKVMADLFLLSGRTQDASIWYTEALQLFKPSVDSIWQASALEGLATISVLDAWSTGQGLQTSSNTSREPWSESSDKLTQATALYCKPSIIEGEQNMSLLSYLYCTCVLRHSSLLFSIWSAKGWGPLAFTTMLHSGPIPYVPPTVTQETRDSWSKVERLSMISGVSRHSISNVIAQAHGPWLLHLGVRERISILEVMASMYSCLGYKRKEAYILREVLGCIMDLIVCGREDGSHPPFSNGAGLGIHGITANSTTQVGVRLTERSDGNQSVLELLKRVCRVLGVNLDAVKTVDLLDSPISPATDDTADNQEPFGWPELQVGVIRESIAVAEALPDFLAVAQYALSSLKTLIDVLTPGDQYHLYSTAARALSTAKRRGSSTGVEFWLSRPIVSIALAPLPLIRLPIEKPMSALQPRPSDPNTILTGATDPFLYNPRRVDNAQDRQLVIENEVLEFVVLLHNPYAFDLELECVSLSTSGVPFLSEPIRVVIPACTDQPVILEGKPQRTGNLVIRGCIVQTPGGIRKEIHLPLATFDEEERCSRDRSSLQSESDRFKYSGLEALPWEKAIKRQSKHLAKGASDRTIRYLECKVVPEQPLLRIRRTSVTHGALMLYDGEMSTLQMTLENISPLAIDFIRLVCSDSTIAPAQQALAEGNLSVFDTYETEYALINQPVFSWNKKDDMTIPPHRKTSLTISCFGKVGCTAGTIHVSYSYVHRSAPDVSDVLHTRQLSFPLMVTVYHMLECHGMDILPFPSFFPKHLDKSSKERIPTAGIDNETNWCLFAVDVRNAYGSPFKVSVDRMQDGVPDAGSSVTIPPGLTSRVIIPIRKFILSEEHTSRPIPTLSDRQFVVDKSKLPENEQKVQRELFWYREELFKSLCCRWQEANGTRFGDLSLRRQRLTLNMLETLRSETIVVRLSLVRHATGTGSAVPVAQKHGKHYPPSYHILRLRTKITNMSRTPHALTVNIHVEPTEHMIHDGALSEIPVGTLGKNESQEIDVGICFLSHGRFDINAVAKVVGNPHQHEKGMTHLACIVGPEE